MNSLPDRAAVIGALSCVDHVVGFADDTPVDLLEALRSDVYAKGGDYTPEMLPETPTVAGYGGGWSSSTTSPTGPRGDARADPGRRARAGAVMSADVDVDVLVPTKDRPVELATTLAGLAAQAGTGGPSFRVVVSDQSGAEHGGSPRRSTPRRPPR